MTIPARVTVMSELDDLWLPPDYIISVVLTFIFPVADQHWITNELNGLTGGKFVLIILIKNIKHL